ncbi:hypothetical protein Asppvi_002990 [Aspergillus pseudoviridinutans]|uniref:Uncharacterized protein n=1 Tax=Aspergillus pseudoviridinutans TaxID=1517512 RepID=A0A9P3B7I1_9EURO|nr:uncharacterized protein Asppvi_002990 [Aspergillus pseudoviridinutans]GIJ84150.1 hypothetical protein Asppvi_002990 [Aspergillus pseudoviridinutans]
MILPSISRIYILLIISLMSNRRTRCHATALQGRSLCATGGPDAALRAEHERLGAFESHPDRIPYDMRRALEPIEIETWFHIVSGETDADLVTDEMVTLQVSLHLSETAASRLLFS